MSHKSWFLALATSWVAGSGVPLEADPPEREPIPEAAAVRLVIPPEIDGQVTDAVWQNVPETRPFVLLDRPDPARNRTTARIAFDEEALYIAFDCRRDGEGPWRAFFTERDSPVYLDDCVHVFLSPTSDPERYFHFVVNSLGTPYDARCDPVWGSDSGWDGLWVARAAPSTTGWGAEIALPWDTLAPVAPAKVWRINLGRQVWQGASTPFLAPGTTMEASAWSGPYGGFHTPDRWGRLTGVTVPPDLLAVTAELLPPWVLVPGFNRLRWKVSNGSPELRSLELQVQLGKAQASRFCRVPAQGETEVELNLEASSLGTGRIQVSLWDRQQKRRIWQGLVPVQIRPGLTLIPDRSYYTTEEQAFLHFDLAPPLAQRTDLSARWSMSDPEGRLRSREVSLSRPAAIDLTSLPVGTHVVRAAVRSAEERLAKAETILRKLPPHEHTVQIGAQQQLWVDGHPFFPRGFYGVAREERHYRLLAETGFNTVVYEAIPEGGVQDDFQAAQSDLDLLHRCGLKSIVDFSGALRGPRNAQEEIQRGVEQLRDHPALLAWEILEESSDGDSIDPEELQAAYELISSLDPYHPLLVNFAVAGFSRFPLGAMDLIGRALYPVPQEPLGTVATSIKEVQRWSPGSRPIWITLQAFAKPPAFTRPTFMQVRCMTYLALLRGAQALLYYLYGYPGDPTGEPMPDAYPSLWGEFPRLAQEIPALLPILAATPVGSGSPAGPSVTVEAEGSGLEWQGRYYQDHLYLLAVNSTPEPLALIWHLPERPRAQVGILFGQAHWDLEAGTFHDVLDGYATRVYVVW